jgi:predicted XRE-type DNA-binding protein
VGKGKNNRLEVISGRKKDFIDTTNEIKKIGLKSVVIKLYENLSEEQSFELETKTINEIGRIDLGTGYLINKTSGGQGNSGYKFLEESLKKQRKNFQDIKNEFEKRNYILLTEEKDYKNAHQKLKYICPKGHDGFITWGHFQQKRDCPICYNESRSEKMNGKNSKLTEYQVIQIKLLLKNEKLKLREIAELFEVNIQTIHDIKTGKTWSYIKI